MTAEEEIALLQDYLATCARLSDGFGFTAGLLASILPIDADRIDRLPVDEETTVLAFLKRFEQFEDVLNRTLKAISKMMEHGRIERLTSVDVARRAYVLGILADGKIWGDAVRARNALAHEYPLNPVKRAAQLNNAWAARETLSGTWSAIQRFVVVEGLLG